MSLAGTLARIELLAGRGVPSPLPVASPLPSAGAVGGTTAVGTPASSSANASAPAGAFAHQLQALLPTAAAPGAGSAGSGVGARVLAAAQGELGVREAPPGSNDGQRIAQYRASVPGGPVGPWCAYFTSWAARQAGVPLGEQGQGFAAVAQVMAWAQRSGRAVPAGGRPQAGDLIVWGGRHIGIVESVAPDGRITTIEGNSSDAVSRRTYGPDGGGATGYVRLGT